MKIRKIEASQVKEERRMAFLLRHIGPRWASSFEQLLNQWMKRLSCDYSGDYWNYFELSNGGFYLTPSATKKTFLMTSTNFARENVSADAAGIIVTMLALTELMGIMDCKGDGGLDNIIERYNSLRDFAIEHHERERIFSIIY